jgi:hypothetical protein
MALGTILLLILILGKLFAGGAAALTQPSVRSLDLAFAGIWPLPNIHPKTA